jgi:hypothetical protein
MPRTIADAKLIDHLGGSVKLAKRLRLKHAEAVMNWRRRGIPWRWRPRLARMAERVGFQLPKNFLNPNR